MKENYFESETFSDINFAENPLPKGDYEDCTFTNCNFNSFDFAGISFIDCRFNICDWSAAKLSLSALRNIKFTDCKLTGIHFDHCNPFLFEVSFEKCILSLSSFYGMKIRKTNFNDSIMHEVDFTESDLSNAKFNLCDLKGAIFDRTIIEKADLRTSFNYAIDPAINKIKKAKFALPGVLGLLSSYDIVIEK